MVSSSGSLGPGAEMPIGDPLTPRGQCLTPIHPLLRSKISGMTPFASAPAYPSLCLPLDPRRPYLCWHSTPMGSGKRCLAEPTQSPATGLPPVGRSLGRGASLGCPDLKDPGAEPVHPCPHPGWWGQPQASVSTMDRATVASA